MSQTPFTQPPFPQETRTSVMAIVALSLGVVGILLFPLAFVALILGIVALVRMNKNPSLQGKGFAIAGTALGGAGIAFSCLSLGILLPALGKARQTARQMKDMVQVRAMVQSLTIYSMDNKGAFPEPGADWQKRLIDMKAMDPILFESPLSDSAPTPQVPHYLYFPPASAEPDRSFILIMTNPAIMERGSGSIGYADGRAESASKQVLERTLADLNAPAAKPPASRPRSKP